jgi:hypothetical protein
MPHPCERFIKVWMVGAEAERLILLKNALVTIHFVARSLIGTVFAIILGLVSEESPVFPFAWRVVEGERLQKQQPF